MNHQAVRGHSITAAILLMASGILSVGAAALRWHGCLGADAGGYGCVQAQDHRYDYVLPAGPWVPVGGAAELSGLALIALAAALGVLGRSLPGVLLRGCIAAPAALVFLVGATALASGLAGAPAAAGWVTPLGLAYSILWPVGTSTASTVLLLLGRSWAAAAVLLALAAGSPLAEYMVLMRLSGSHDTPPWSGAYHGAATIVAGLVLAAAAFHRRRRASHRVASVTV